MGEILPLLLGGLVLFLYGVIQLSGVLKGAFGDTARALIRRYTRNLYWGMLVGTLLTISLGSSSAVIILVIVLVNARALKLKHVFGIVMGANIGTTFSSQVFSLDIMKYAAVPLILGLLLQMIGNEDKQKRLGKILLYMGMLFFGLFVMEQSVAPLRESEVFAAWIAGIENNALKGALLGGLITLVIQSSSGTVGMAIVLGKQQLLSLAGGIAIMIGAELGTCSDTLLATIKGSRQGLKTGLFHLFFNLTTILLGLVFFDPFVWLVDWVAWNDNLGRNIANAHVLFNVLGVLLFIPLVPLTERILNALLPDKKPAGSS